MHRHWSDEAFGATSEEDDEGYVDVQAAVERLELELPYDDREEPTWGVDIDD